MHDRRQAVFSVEIDGVDLREKGFSGLIESVEIVDSDEDTSDAFKVVLNNQGLRFTDDPLFGEESKVKISMGYPGEVQKWGPFVMDKPTFSFPAQGNPQITLQGKGEDINLARSAGRGVMWEYPDAYAGVIVWRIAEKHGLDHYYEGPEGPIINRHGANEIEYRQGNMDDLSFLQRMAAEMPSLFPGEAEQAFKVYVENGVLHFHPPQPEDLGIKLAYREGGVGTLRDFRISERTFRSVFTVDVVGLDVRDKSKIEAEGKGILDAEGRYIGPERVAYEIIDKVQNQPVVKLVDFGHAVTQEQKDALVKALVKDVQWMVKGEGQAAVGLPAIRAKRIIRLVGLGRFGGKYRIKEARHKVDRSGVYTTSFVVESVGTGSFHPAPFFGSGSSSAGTRRSLGSLDHVR